MASEVTLPALGESVTEGTVTRWLKQVGDTVAVDEPLLEVSTDKVDTEIPSPVAGTLLEIKANEDDTVEVGAVLAVVGDEGESAGDADDTAEPEAQPKDEEQAEKKAEQEQEIAEDKGELPAGDETPEADKADSAAAGRRGRVRWRPSGGASGGGSSTSVTLPALGESVTEGTVTRWLKQVGDDVAVDEPLLEVSTDKVDTEIPSPVAGTLLEIKVQEDETVEVGAELATIGDQGASPADASGSATPRRSPRTRSRPRRRPSRSRRSPRTRASCPPATRPPRPRSRTPGPRTQGQQAEPPAGEAQYAGRRSSPSRAGHAEQAVGSPRASRGDDQSAYVTPLVRKMAAQHGVDLGSVSGTGVGGRIRKQDVLDAAAAAQQQAQQPAAPARSRGARRGARGRWGCPERGPVAAARHHREGLAAAQDHRRADARLAADLGPAHPGDGGRRDHHRPPARAGEG